MNWEAMGAIGETVGAIGVILSLVYLALQIRHSSEQTRINTKSVQATAYQQLIDHHSVLNQQLATNPDLFDVVMRVEINGADKATPLEFNRWEVFISSSLRSYLNAYYLHRDDLITQEQFDNFCYGLSTMVRRPAFRVWWAQERTKRQFPAGFVELMDNFEPESSS